MTRHLAWTIHLIALTACTRETNAGPPAPTSIGSTPASIPSTGEPMSPRERVQAAFPGRSLMGPVPLTKGVDLFGVVQHSGPPKDVSIGVVVVDGAVEQGAAGFTVVAPRLAGDAARLAQAAAHLLPQVGVVLDAPTLSGSTLRFKAGRGAPMRRDRMVTIDLQTGAVSEPAAAPTGLSVLLQQINGANIGNRDAALKQLALGKLDGAAAALATVAQQHAIAEVRAEATRLMATCADAQTVEILMTLLTGPADGQVRMHAAQGL
ncbi:MAG: hypothetical protein ACI9U2_005039, partial [Bradymonadia bacterium]